ncbi:MAG: site-2 protease family protein [Candidatus Bathyarchaeia archaeon]
MSFSLGKIFGITIRIHYTLLLFLILVIWSLAVGYMPQQYPGLPQGSYWMIGAASGLLLIISVVVHEVCHSIVARRFGIPVRRITLFFLGGVSELPEEPRDPNVEFKTAAAGPVSSFAIATILAILWYYSITAGHPPELTAILQYGASINGALGAFNLLPAFPLDGGRILRSTLWRLSGNMVKATRSAAKVGITISYLMMFGGFTIAILGGFFSGLWIIFIGLFIRSGAESGLSQTVISQALAGTTVNEIMTRDVTTVDSNLTIEELVNEYFLRKKHAGYPVLKDGMVVGLVTMEDVKDIPKNQWSKVTVGEVMKPLSRVATIEPEASAADAMYKMSRTGVGRILVMRDSNLLGIVSRRDLTHLIYVKTELMQ